MLAEKVVDEVGEDDSDERSSLSLLLLLLLFTNDGSAVHTGGESNEVSVHPVVAIGVAGSC